ncbi:MAG: sigma-B regulation protein RsbU (phosphoserine phosphatase) [Crocinitomix sp.]|jgi:sigma-B regulation protein RsbU (phosphoserine phosphatase)
MLQLAKKISKTISISTGRHTILIVDDRPENLFSLKAVLNANTSYTIDTAISGKEALEKALFNKYDLFLLDVQMPEMDGFQLAEILKSNSKTKNAPIIFLSANATEDENIQKGLKVGAIDFLAKPINNGILTLKLQNHFRSIDYQNELNKAREKLANKSSENEQKANDIMDSINYSKSIQAAVFQNIEKHEEKNKNSFIYYKPKDVIGGDFYFVDNINGYQIMIAADCTGHGVPGAMLSMCGFYSIMHIIKERRVFDPGDILTFLNKKMKAYLNNGSVRNHHGIDLSIAVYQETGTTLEYASAKRPILLSSEKGIEELKGDRVSIGDQCYPNHKFKTYQAEIVDPTWIYMFSDGFSDQFGGEKEKKFGRGRLHELAKSLLNSEAREQKERLISTFKEWKGSCPQTDDIVLIGNLLAPK